MRKLSLQLQVRSYVVSFRSICTHRQRTVDNDLVRILWFGFLVQTFVNFRVFGVLIGLVTVYEYGMQISILGSLATGFAVPSAFQLYEMGPAFMLASQIMISFALEPPTEVEVNRSYAMSATTFPVVVCFHDQADYID